MADGTIEEDFEAALAKGRSGLGGSSGRMVNSTGMLTGRNINTAGSGGAESSGPVDFSG